MSILLGVVMLFALLSGLLAAGQAMAISRMAAASGASWRDWLFGWWRFEQIAHRAGLSGEVQAALYKRAVIACIAFVILGLILSGWAVNERQGSAAIEAAETPITDWRVLPARLAEQLELRRVATMPGATILES
ncbi:hypothetical protein SAMN05216456_1496 [Devosia crocina]|uniref:Uncharacterized protein n=1 Tax=Devosia crocina TaxID=429728 RepID=A0A1I7NB96_9HYPH|nr:hypothetical protein [Devosia crocina]SFV31929.1 hypothetical protein SAMN05216456_1496 [Devosia crocina]